MHKNFIALRDQVAFVPFDTLFKEQSGYMRYGIVIEEIAQGGCYQGNFGPENLILDQNLLDQCCSYFIAE